jgi:trehalose 6-phosphate phosphatase
MIMVLGPPATSLDLRRVALLLDVDGTILDFAPTPREVFVSSSLRAILQSLLERTGGALALVSGRPLKGVDLLFAPLRLPVVGSHGAEIRPTADGPVDRTQGRPLCDDLRRRLAAIVAATPGIILEDKDFGCAIHYRLEPDQEASIRAEVLAICREAAPASVDVLPGNLVIEVKSAGFDKGTAVRQLMTYPPFKGRQPVFVGDDTTDEAAIAVMSEFDGIGISVGRAMPGADASLATPQDVRAWLEQILKVEQRPAQCE